MWSAVAELHRSPDDLLCVVASLVSVRPTKPIP